MKGIIFNLLEGFISDNWGAEKYDEILGKCPVHDKTFVGPKTYPDATLMSIVQTTCDQLGVEVSDGVRLFGEYCLPKLAEKYPMFFEGFDHPKPFLKTIDGVIHVEVNKLFKDAVTPKFTYEDPAENKLVMIYESHRDLPQMAEGLIMGTGKYFDCPIDIQYKKVSESDPISYRFELEFSR